MAMAPDVVDLTAALGVLRDESVCAQFVGRLFAKLEPHMDALCETLDMTPTGVSFVGVEALVDALIETVRRVNDAR